MVRPWMEVENEFLLEFATSLNWVVLGKQFNARSSGSLWERRPGVRGVGLLTQLAPAHRNYSKKIGCGNNATTDP